MSKCPMCFTELSLDKYAFTLRGTGNQGTLNPVASDYAGYSVYHEGLLPMERPAGNENWLPNPGQALVESGAPAGSELEAEVCPECYYPLPDDWRQSQVTCVGLSGARASGKSLYIAVVIKALSHYLVSRGSRMVPVNETTADDYAAVYENQLFGAQKLLVTTSRADNPVGRLRPLIYSLGIINGRRQYIVLRDVPGEELENLPASDQRLHLSFLSRADGIIFMFDPLAIEGIRRRLQDLVPAQIQTIGDPSVVLNNLQILSQGGLGSGRFAVVLSKFDALQHLRNVDDAQWSPIMSNPGAGFMRQAADGANFDENDSQLVSAEVRSLLKLIGGEEIVTQVRNPHVGQPAPHRFFAVSSLGEPPEGENISSLGIAPYRVLDPLLWILAEKGAV